MNNDYIRAELEQLRMVYRRLCDNVDRFDSELTRLETACGMRPDAITGMITAKYPGEPYHWHGKEKCNCKVSFIAPDEHPGESWQTDNPPIDYEKAYGESWQAQDTGQVLCCHGNDTWFCPSCRAEHEKSAPDVVGESWQVEDEGE